MRHKIWSADDVKGTGAVGGAEAGQAPAQPADDRVAELLGMLDGGEGNTPCSVGVPPWFLSAAHTRLAEMTNGTAYADKVDAAFAAGGPSNGQVSPDKLALALAEFDEKFLRDPNAEPFPYRTPARLRPSRDSAPLSGLDMWKALEAAPLECLENAAAVTPTCRS